MPFYNCHIHVFSAQCAPKRFLEVGLPSWADPVASGVKNFLETKAGRWLSYKLAKINLASLKVAARYASFVSVGTMSSQQMIFENILKYYPEGTRFIILTLNMDYMGAGESALTFQGQVDQVIQLRRLYPDSCLPFLSIDPRMGSANDIFAFVQKYIGPGLPFIGVKLYPALGYFPFDARLEKVYEFCQENDVPIMTHCTRSGSFYIGRFTTSMGVPATIGNPPNIPHRFTGRDNDSECDIFLEPMNWEVVLEKFPALKICFAHMGGVREMWLARTKTYPFTWYDDVLGLMGKYKNVYADVSYTLFDKAKNYRTWNEIQNLLAGNAKIIRFPEPELNHRQTIKNRVVFGTDYFMTEQEDREANLATDLPNYLLQQNDGLNLVSQLTEKNTENYLRSLFFIP